VTSSIITSKFQRQAVSLIPKAIIESSIILLLASAGKLIFVLREVFDQLKLVEKQQNPSLLVSSRLMHMGRDPEDGRNCGDKILPLE
jgi:hypothetical protein